MNPWGFLILGIGLLLIIMGIKGSYSNIVSAITNKPAKSTSTKSAVAAGAGSPPKFVPTVAL
jgi:hypothetical protein